MSLLYLTSGQDKCINSGFIHKPQNIRISRAWSGKYMVFVLHKWLLNQWFYLLSKLYLTKTLQSIECLWIHVCSLHKVINILCPVCRYQRPSERPCSGPVPIRTASLWASTRTWPRCSETRWSTGHSPSSPGRRSCSGLQGWVGGGAGEGGGAVGGVKNEEDKYLVFLFCLFPNMLRHIVLFSSFMIALQFSLFLHTIGNFFLLNIS